MLFRDSLMRWHGEECKDDVVIRHPTDSSGWKDFDNKHLEFASDVRNVRIGLASDGFNPYRNMSLSHSTWPVDNTFLLEEAQSIVYQMLNACWKAWKYRIKNNYKKYHHNERKMYKMLDKRVDEDQFQEVIRHWEKPEVQLASHGICATQLDIWLLSRSIGKGVKEDYETSNLYEFLLGTMNGVPPEERTTEFREKLYNEAIRNDKHGRDTCIGKSIHKKSRGTSSSEHDASNTGRHTRTVLEPRISPNIVSLDGIKGNFFCFGIPKIVVAEGVLVSKDLEEKVDNVPFGPDDWKIFVATAVHPNYEFCREANKKVSTIGRVIGKYVAWPISNVMESH
ncbi:hypothetical protein LIER_15365 [Lithospermum erythrorhizon]|uniref:Transposase n=1 Tax=Lithospermum erythrorhizon TaxID=34254 RepID=A0AAV3Q4X4_LITER